MSSISSNDEQAMEMFHKIQEHTLSGDDVIKLWLDSFTSITRPWDREYRSDLCELPGVRDLLTSHALPPGTNGGFIPIVAGYNVLEPTLIKYVSVEGEELHARIGCPASEKPTDPEGGTSIQALVFDNFVRKGYHPVWSATGSGLLSSLLLTAESLKAAREIAVSEQEYPRSHPRERWLPCPSDVGA
jgi:hypothetical protein